jgi:dTMP kinase
MSGLFVTFEGIDGCGKSTQVALVKKMLDERGVACTVTREPGGSPIGERIREILLATENRAMCNACEVLLYLAARAQHVTETIAPALSRGTVVLCDRFMEATLAYQGFGRGMALESLASINGFATDGAVPDVTFVFDIDIDTAFTRLHRSGKEPDRLESSGREFFEKVRNGYLTLAAQSPLRITVLDGTKSPDSLCAAVWERIEKKMRSAV